MMRMVNIPKNKYEMIARIWSDLRRKRMNPVMDVPKIKPRMRNNDKRNITKAFLFFIFVLINLLTEFLL